MIADAILVVGSIVATIVIGGLLAWRLLGKAGDAAGDALAKDEVQRRDDGHGGAGN